MDCSATVFVDEFSIFSTFSAVLLVLGRPERSSSSTDTGPALKCEYHSKTVVRLKECSPIASRRISVVSVAGFAKLHAKLDADALLDFAIHRRQNEKRSRKSTRVKTMLVHSAVSCGSLIQ
jgi:hypothetical protein